MLKYEKNAFIYSYLGFTTRGLRMNVHSAWVVMVAKTNGHVIILDLHINDQPYSFIAPILFSVR